MNLDRVWGFCMFLLNAGNTVAWGGFSKSTSEQGTGHPNPVTHVQSSSHKIRVQTETAGS